MNTGQKGAGRERQVRALLESQGWWTCRAAGSLGDADIVALKTGERPRLIEVKSNTGGPFKNFSPADRAELLEAAAIAGDHFGPADAWLIHWPARKPPRWLHASTWPQPKGENSDR